VDWQIDKLIRETGAISPYDPDLLNSASLDVTLGEDVLIEEATGFEPVSIKGGTMVLPNVFLLACTQEVFNLPSNISCEFHLKSSRARDGWGHVLSAMVAPGFAGSSLTLELKNYTRFQKLPLFAGARIGHVVFYEHQHCLVPYSVTGRYNGDRTAQRSRC
jgi:dCTP deaminase